MAGNRAKLFLGFTTRLVELALIYGHFFGALFFASDYLKKVLPESSSINTVILAIPLFLALAFVLFGFLMVFVWELNVAGQPRIMEPSVFHRIVRKVLRIAIMVGFAVCLAIFLVYATLSIRAAYANPLEQAITAAVVIAVSLFMLVQAFWCHSLWLRRLVDYGNSAFATVPAVVQHLLPNQGEPRERLKQWILRDSIVRIVLVWLLGFSTVSLGVVYMRFLFNDANDASNHNWIPQLVVGLLAWLWISLSLTFFWLGARRREIDIIDGNYQSGPRSRCVSVYFAICFFAGFVLGATCFATNLYRVVTTMQGASLQHGDIEGLLIAWPIFAFYITLLVDTVLIHARNVHEEQSVCVRVPAPLSLGMDYSSLHSTENGLAYDPYDF